MIYIPVAILTLRLAIGRGALPPLVAATAVISNMRVAYPAAMCKV